MKNCFIIDIDGTLANGAHRQHFLDQKPKDWDGFYAGALEDAPFEHMRSVLHGLMCVGVLVFVSGRPEALRAVTIQWLRKHKFWYVIQDPPLYLRHDGDFRPDDLIKKELLARLRADGYNPTMAFDDRDRVVKMWRANGIPCAQVAEGDF